MPGCQGAGRKVQGAGAEAVSPVALVYVAMPKGSLFAAPMASGARTTGSRFVHLLLLLMLLHLGLAGGEVPVEVEPEQQRGQVLLVPAR